MENMIVVTYETKKGKIRTNFYECTCQGVDDALEYIGDFMRDRMNHRRFTLTIDYLNPNSKEK